MSSSFLLNIDGQIKDYHIVLSKVNLVHIGEISNITDLNIKRNLNAPNEISFSVYKEINGNKNNLWDDIVDLRCVYVVELDEYFQIKAPISESVDLCKNVSGLSLCESELGQTLVSFEINTEDDIARESYDENFPTVFYRDPDDQSVYNYIWNTNPNKYSVMEDGELDISSTYKLRKKILEKSSFMHRILYKNPNYKIGDIDDSLKNIQRTFSETDVFLYDFLSGEASEQFGCLFEYDSVSRSISAHDLQTVCMNDSCTYYKKNKRRYRGDFENKCPYCGSNNLKFYGKDTTVYVSVENLSDEIDFSAETDKMKNTFKLQGGDDLMTAQIALCNPGGNYIINFNKETMKDMSADLKNKINEYSAKIESSREQYSKYVQNWQNASAQEDYLSHTMMPAASDIAEGIATVSPDTEIIKLTPENLSPMSVSSLSSTTTSYTISAALKNYAKVFVKTGYVSIDIFDDNFQYDSINSTDILHKGIWTGRFRLTSYYKESSEDDYYYRETDLLSIEVNDDNDSFINQKLMKEIAKKADDDHSVFDVLAIEDIDDFKDALKLYCLERLKSFHDAIESAVSAIISVDQASPGSDLYDDFYLPYMNKVRACSDEMDTRKIEIDRQQTIQKDNLNNMQIMRDSLNFEKYLGENLYNEYITFRREDVYRNDNYISDGLSNDEVIAKANEFIEQAKKEVIKFSTPTYSISTSLHNLLLMPEFESINRYFALGNWIRVKVDDEIYRLRLISYQYDFSNIEKINVEFSTATKTADGLSDISSILSQATSTASTISYIQTQAEKGGEISDRLNQIMKNGLESALVTIKNNDSEDILIDNTGIHLRDYDDTTGKFSPEQAVITHNIIGFTEDNFNTVSLALGKHPYIIYDRGSDDFVARVGYGMSAKFLTAPYINGAQIIAGHIYSNNYSKNYKTGCHIDLETGEFTLGGEKIGYNPSSDELKLVNSDLVVITEDDSGVVGKLTIDGEGFNTYDQNNVNRIKIVNGRMVFKNSDGNVSFIANPVPGISLGCYESFVVNGVISEGGEKLSDKYNSKIKNSSSILSSVNIPTVSGTDYTLVGQVAPDYGTYLVTLSCRFQMNNNGFRAVAVSTKSSGSGDFFGSEQLVKAANDANTVLQAISYVTIDDTSPVIYFFAKQNSGSTLSVIPHYTLLKID